MKQTNKNPRIVTAHKCYWQKNRKERTYDNTVEEWNKVLKTYREKNCLLVNERGACHVFH